MTRCNAYPNHLNRLKRVEILISLNHRPYFLKPPKLNDANHLIVQPEFPVFPCKCKGIKVYFGAFSFVRNSVCG